MKEMDFYTMKRKKLQALCKKHGIPANLKNVVMAEKLSLIFKGKENSGLGFDDAGEAKGGTFRGVSGKNLQNVINLDSDSSNDASNVQMVASDIAVAGDVVDSWEEKFVSLGKISPGPDLGQKILKIGGFEESEMNLFQERVFENGPSKEEQVVDSAQEDLHSEPDEVGMDFVTVDSKEFGDHFVEAEVEKLDDNTDVFRTGKVEHFVEAEVEKLDDNTDVFGTPKVEQPEAEKQVDDYSPQESNRNDLYLLRVSAKDFGQPSIEEVHNSEDNVCCVHASPEKSTGNLVEGEVHQLDDNISVHGAVFNDRNNISEAVSMCLDASIHFKDIVPGTAFRTEDKIEAKFVSSQKLSISPASEKTIGFSPKCDLEPPIEADIAMFGVEENMPVGVNRELVDNSQGVLHADPSVVVMKEKNLVQVTPEEFGKHLEEGEVEKLGDKFDLLDDVCGTGEGGDEAVEQGHVNSPQGPNINNMKMFHVSPEESEQVQKSDDNICVNGALNIVGNEISEAFTSSLDTSVGAKNTDGNINVTADNFLDEVHSFSLKYSDGMPDQILLTNPLGEVKSCDLGVHHMVASGTAARNVDACEVKFVSSQKISSSPEENSSPILLENSQIKRFGKLSPENRNDLGFSSGYLIEEGEVHQPVDNICVHGDACNDKNNISEAVTMCLDASIDCKDNMSVEQILDEAHSSSFQDSEGTPVQFPSTYPEKSSGSLVEGGEVHKSDDNICVHGAACDDKNNISEAVTMCVDASINCKDNVSDELILDEAQSSSFQDSEGTPVQFPSTYPGTAIRTEDTCEAKFVSAQKLVISPASEKMIGFSPKKIHNLETPIEDDIEMCYVEEIMQVGINKEQVEEFGKHLEEGEDEKLGEKTDLLDDVCGAGEGGGETVKQGGVYSPRGSNLNDVNLSQVSPEESGYPLFEQVQKSDNNDLHGGFYNLGNSESEVDILRLLDATIANMDTDEKTNVTGEHFPDEVHSSSVEYSDGTADQFLTTLPQDTCEEMMKSSQMKAIIADLEECVWLSPNNVEASASRSFEDETHSDPSTLGDVVGACNMEESMHSDNSDVHNENGGTGEENHPYMLGRKRKRSDMNSNESQPVDNASGQNSNEKPDEFVPTEPQPGEMMLHLSNTHQYFASDTASGGEVTYQEKLESPPKVTPIARSAKRTFFSPKLLESSMMNKENINIDKKEQVGTTTSKNEFLKRQPLQDLQQN